LQQSAARFRDVGRRASRRCFATCCLIVY
jgi:hypothetical protein